MRKPCNKCESALSYEYKGKMYYCPSSKECGGMYGQTCEKYQKYLAYRESKRKYKRGDQIKTIDEFDKYIHTSSFVYWNKGIKHFSILISMPYRVVKNAIDGGIIYKAIKKEVEQNAEERI